jgi:hypothetical protein
MILTEPQENIPICNTYGGEGPLLIFFGYGQWPPVIPDWEKRSLAEVEFAEIIRDL